MYGSNLGWPLFLFHIHVLLHEKVFLNGISVFRVVPKFWGRRQVCANNLKKYSEHEPLYVKRRQIINNIFPET